MQPLIDPVSLDLIKAELTPEKKLCDTNKGHNVLYVFDSDNAPNLMLEVGRLRELTFRDATAGTGAPYDWDEFDHDHKYRQIIVWDQDAEAIIGGYRYVLGPDMKIKEDGQPDIVSSHMFRFSEKFVKDYLPHVMELSRAFVVPEYQSSKAGAKALFALDNLWDGLGAVIMQHHDIMYFMGKMSMYQTYDPLARNLIMSYLWKHFRDRDNLAVAMDPIVPDLDERLVGLILKDDDLKDDYKNLNSAVRSLGTNIPPMINAYMTLSPTMKVFGTGVNREFGDVLDTGIMICFNEMYEEKRERHIKSFVKNSAEKIKQRYPGIAENLEEIVTQRWAARRAKQFTKFMQKLNAKPRRRGRKAKEEQK
ncbi:MAG: GNAT family N-acetyltransferase [Bacteroidales bacterium]|nr:GNAT family N-acetyltransferase [Bacteroidales bacterium]